MNFDFSDDQQAIKRTAKELLADRFKPERVRELAESGSYDDDAWKELCELGWPGIFIGEEHGGQGLGTVELIILMAELGYALAPLPFLSNAAAGLVLNAAGSDEQKERWLPGIDAGEALECDRIPGISRVAAALAAELTGIAQRAMEMAVEYARERKQFGRPIGSYQAVSHRCAQMLLETEGARSASYYAAWCGDAEPETLPLAACMAKAYASDAGWRVCTSGLQVHGGIGFTWEHDLHFFLKRAKVDALLYGSAREHRDAVAALSRTPERA